MALTNIELVKKHLRERIVPGPQVENVPVKPVGTAASQLPNTSLLANSEKVKAQEATQPTFEQVALTSAGVPLLHPEIVPDSVVVAKDSSLAQVYVENVDYAVDYDAGKIKRIGAGSITEGQSVAVWYFFFRLYTKGVDYTIDYGKGKLTRLSSGAIEDGQVVLCDYSLDLAALGDDVIANAILEAEDRVTKFVDPTYLATEDQSLVTGATYWAVAVLCNSQSLEAMQASAASGVQARALSRSWSIMANVYNRRGLEMLTPFARPQPHFASPRAVTGR